MLSNGGSVIANFSNVLYRATYKLVENMEKPIEYG